ncbi:MAG: SAM-dependent methyltransferase, partial [Myxococcales bacterium]|nr:SAM-dependent methyltransferase [Myxococcales bacterium]
YHPAWRRAEGGGVYSAWIPEILDAGFDDLETFCFDSRPSFTPRAWRSRARASAGEDGVLRAPELARFDQELASVLARRFPTEAFRVPHRVFALIARRPLRG